MWAEVARDLGIPWRTVEAMHWIIDKQEMARRAGVTPFAMAGTDSSNPNTRPRSSGRDRSSESRVKKGGKKKPTRNF